MAYFNTSLFILKSDSLIKHVNLWLRIFMKWKASIFPCFFFHILIVIIYTHSINIVLFSFEKHLFLIQIFKSLSPAWNVQNEHPRNFQNLNLCGSGWIHGCWGWISWCGGHVCWCRGHGGSCTSGGSLIKAIDRDGGTCTFDIRRQMVNAVMSYLMNIMATVQSINDLLLQYWKLSV